MNHKQHHHPRAGVHGEQRGEVQDGAQEGVQAHSRRDLPEGKGDQVSLTMWPNRIYSSKSAAFSLKPKLQTSTQLEAQQLGDWC